MQVLKVLSGIWKSGAEMNLLPTDEIELKYNDRVPAEIMSAAEKVFPEIEKWFASWKDASPVNITIRKMVHQACGWQDNPKLNEWICTDSESLTLFIQWQESLAKNGWDDIYSDYRQFENDESNVMKQKIYERAILYANQNK
ncbi:hypothetical protein ACIQ2D_08755 [Lysinibacillus sp. NPDC097287]|uniref:hypothetical protein n=1 Tax=Lysinibacillus sp. NPDC097287 TaxID=3364144 RepID=UPI00380108E8